jgi:hypothetical protein
LLSLKNNVRDTAYGAYGGVPDILGKKLKKQTVIKHCGEKKITVPNILKKPQKTKCVSSFSHTLTTPFSHTLHNPHTFSHTLTTHGAT